MSGPQAAAAAPAALSGRLTPVPFAALPGWNEDRFLAAFHAFARSARHAAEKPYRTGRLGVAFSAFETAYAAARHLVDPDEAAARAFFEKHFRPARLAPEGGRGFVTGYYEPEIAAARAPDSRFHVPLYARPADLVDVEESNRPAGMDASFAFARRDGDRLVEYFDRRAIDNGALAGRGLEIAWLDNRIDAYFVHVQGAARLALNDGTAMRVTYAAKSGHPFTGAGKVLIARGALDPHTVTMQTIRAWLAAHPGRVDEILWRNRSYIFFRETPLGVADKGPVAAAKVQLEPGRSVAVDRLLHTFGTPLFIDAPTLDAFGNGPFRRLMIAQDTGSAITGPARGDLFAGTGAAAGAIAGTVRHDADFYVLVPRSLVETGR